MNHHRLRVIIAATALWLMSGATAALAAGNISSTEKYAWSGTAGWFNFAPSGGGVTVCSDHLEGYAWQENIGWIRLGSHTGGGTLTYGNSSGTDWGLNRSGTALSGFAWSETAGWINFKPAGGGVTLNEQSGEMDGFAWGENIGWVHIRCTSPAYGVQFLPIFGVSAIVFDGASGYAAQDGAGIWKSTDSGATWTAATTQPANQRVKALVIHPVTRSTLFAATYGGGVYASVNSGADWTVCANTNLGSLNVVSLSINPAGNLYAGTEAGIFTSTDGCSSWSAVGSGLAVDASKPPVAISIDSSSSTLYAGLDGAGVFKSVSGGAWADANGTTSNNLANLRVKSVLINANTPATLYAATYGGGVFKTGDAAASWSACATQPTNLNVLSLTMDGSGRLYAGTEAGVFVSTDGCGTWSAINSGLP